LEVDSSRAPLLVYTEAEPGAAYQVDSRIIILGALVEDPARNLVGYDGSAELAVWSRLALALAEEIGEPTGPATPDLPPLPRDLIVAWESMKRIVELADWVIPGHDKPFRVKK